MNREYHKWYSPSLGQNMELRVFGRAGRPYIVFPTSSGRFFDFENNNDNWNWWDDGKNNFRNNARLEVNTVKLGFNYLWNRGAPAPLK